MNQLTQCCPQTTTDELVDIREVTVDKDLPKEERIAASSSTGSKPLSLSLRRVCGKRRICQQWGHIGGMPARDLLQSTSSLFFQKRATMHGKG